MHLAAGEKEPILTRHDYRDGDGHRRSGIEVNGMVVMNLCEAQIVEIFPEVADAPSSTDTNE